MDNPNSSIDLHKYECNSDVLECTYHCALLQQFKESIDSEQTDLFSHGSRRRVQPQTPQARYPYDLRHLNIVRNIITRFKTR